MEPRAVKRTADPIPSSTKIVGVDVPQTVRHAVQPTVEFSRNAKGDASWSIKVSGDDLVAVLEEVRRADRHLRNLEESRSSVAAAKEVGHAS